MKQAARVVTTYTLFVLLPLAILVGLLAWWKNYQYPQALSTAFFVLAGVLLFGAYSGGRGAMAEAYISGRAPGTLDRLAQVRKDLSLTHNEPLADRTLA